VIWTPSPPPTPPRPSPPRPSPSPPPPPPPTPPTPPPTTTTTAPLPPPTPAADAARAATAAATAAAAAAADDDAADAADAAFAAYLAAADAADAAADAAFAAFAAYYAAGEAARADYDGLLELDLGTYPEPGQPIDPTDRGPLGPLWPEDRKFESFGDIVPDVAESPAKGASQEMLRSRIDRVLKSLSYREREIIKLRYGLGDGYSYTLEEVGHIFKVNRERIRQIEAKAGSMLHVGECDSGDGDCPSLEVFIEPGNASKETIQEVLEALSDLHREAGGLGLEFSVDGLFVMAREEVLV
jgi:RNA polymerase sigma factor (sigma-70 family)